MHLKPCKSWFLMVWNFFGLRGTVLLAIWFSWEFLPYSFIAQAADIYGPACGKAVIDGIINPTEWTGASTKTFQMVNPNNQQVFEVTLRIVNDNNFLYLGLTINDDEFTTQAQFLPGGDAFRIDFDNDHCGSLFAVGDDTLIIQAGSPQFQDGYIVGGTSSPADTTGGGTSDGTGAASRQGSLNHFELKHPLCSGDLLDFCLHPGDIVGFRLEYLDAGAGGTYDGSYYYPGSTNTSLLILSSLVVLFSTCLSLANNSSSFR
jgi:hypothetical protein